MNVTLAPPAATAKDGVTNSVLPTFPGPGAKASFGALKGLVADVTHGTSAPVAALVQPAGSAGATTPSKFSVKVAAVTPVVNV